MSDPTTPAPPPAQPAAGPPPAKGRGCFFYGCITTIVILVVMGIVAFFAWFACLFLGRMPEGMRNLLAFTIRYHAQTQAYMSLVTSQYPSFNVGLDAT